MSGNDGQARAAVKLAVDAGRRAGLDVRGAKIFRLRSSIHVELPLADALARVEAPGREALAERQVEVARTWALRGAPIVGLIRPDLQPFVLPGGGVTLWQRLRARGPVCAFDLGRTTRRLHDSTRGLPLDRLPRLDPLADVKSWIDWPADWLRREDRAALRARLEDVSERWKDELEGDPLGTVLAHGDLHPDNALDTETGAVLCDLEDSGVGPAAYDFAPLAVGVRRYGAPATTLEEFIAGYGQDPLVWPGHDLACRAYELNVVLWSLRCSGETPEMASEARIRVEGLLGRSSAPWTLR